MRVSSILTGFGLALGVASPAFAQTFSADELAERALYRRAVEAANWGIPVVNFDRMYQAVKANGGDFNQVQANLRERTCRE